MHEVFAHGKALQALKMQDLVQRAMDEEGAQQIGSFYAPGAFKTGAFKQGPPPLQTLLRQRLAAQQQVRFA